MMNGSLEEALLANSNYNWKLRLKTSHFEQTLLFRSVGQGSEIRIALYLCSSV